MNVVGKFSKYVLPVVFGLGVMAQSNEALAEKVKIPTGSYASVEAQVGDSPLALDKKWKLEPGTVDKLNPHIGYTVNNKGEKISNLKVGETVLIRDLICELDKAVLNPKNNEMNRAIQMELDLDKHESEVSCRTLNVKPGEGLWALARRFGTKYSVDFKRSIWDQIPVKGGVRKAENLQVGQEVKFCDKNPLINLFKDDPLEVRLRKLVLLDSDQVWSIRSLNRDKDGSPSTPFILASIAGVTPGIGANDDVIKDDELLGNERLNNLVLNYDILLDNAKKTSNIDIYDLLAIKRIESGGLFAAISRTGALGFNQLVRSNYENINPFNVYLATENGTKILSEGIRKFGRVLGILSYNQGDTVVRNLISFADKSNTKLVQSAMEANLDLCDFTKLEGYINYKDNPEKLIEVGFQKELLSKEAYGYYSDFKRNLEYVKSQNIFKPESVDVRKLLIARLKDKGRVFEVYLPEGKVQQSYLTNAMWDQINKERKVTVPSI